MGQIKKFILTTILGGLLVILPVAILIMAGKFVFEMITDMIAPFTSLILSKYSMPMIVANLFVIFIIVGFCFSVGLLIRTSFGQFMHNVIEVQFLSKIPGYKIVKETVLQFFGNQKSPFSSVAYVNLYDSETLASAFITDEHPDGNFTVFIPTGPNPTSGQIFHLKKEHVHPVDVPVEDMMRSIISCGAGSSRVAKIGDCWTVRAAVDQSKTDEV